MEGWIGVRQIGQEAATGCDLCDEDANARTASLGSHGQLGLQPGCLPDLDGVLAGTLVCEQADFSVELRDLHPWTTVLLDDRRCVMKAGESPVLRAYGDFLVSRESMRCTPKTMTHYRYTVGAFVEWLRSEGIEAPSLITASHVRQYLNGVRQRGVKDTTLHAHARGIKTMLRFLDQEGYVPAPVPIKMPRVDKKRMPYLEADEVQRLVDACTSPRDRALVMLMADSGLRLEETRALVWGDVDVKSGLIEVRRGKGGKARTAVVGESARGALRDYRRWWVQTNGGVPDETDTLWPSGRTGEPLTGSGLSSVIRRLAGTAGIKASPHMFRRTFATLSLRAGMSPFHLQALLGHSTLEMTRRYIGLVDRDLQQAHQQFGPLDHVLGSGRLKRKGE